MIYTQSEILPLLIQIARLDCCSSNMYPAYFLPDILTCRAFYEDRINFGLVDYRTNHSTIFSVDVNVDNVTFVGEVYDTLARSKETISG